MTPYLVSKRALLALLACLAFSAQAQTFPTKPVRIVVAQAAGGGMDTLARLIAQGMSDGLRQPVVVENKAGAGGIIGTTYVTKAPADGYTLLLAPIGNMVFTQLLSSNLPFSPQRDLTPVAMVATFPLILVVSADRPLQTVSDLVSFMRANPHKANYGGSGPAFQFATELFKIKTGTPAEFVQYKSTSEVITALIGGDLLMAFADTGPATASVSGGRLRALAVTSPHRLAALPNVPTMAEIGFPELEIQYWAGIFAPAGTPRPILKQLEAELQRVVGSPGVAERMKSIQVSPATSGSDEFANIFAADLARWTEVARTAKIKPIE